jgi:hypothetical protein
METKLFIAKNLQNKNFLKDFDLIKRNLSEEEQLREIYRELNDRKRFRLKREESYKRRETDQQI